MKESIIRQINMLPPLPKSVHEIEKVYANESATASDMAKIIEKDPMITANILKSINSPYYGLGAKITSVHQAVSLLGMSVTRGLVLQNSIRKLLDMDMEPYNITPEEFAAISNLQSTLMLRWYSQIDKKKLEKLFLSSLLQEMGKIVIANEVIQEELVYQFRSDIKMSDDIAAVERSYVGTTTAAVSAEIFEYWGFERMMIDSIRYSDDYQEAPSEVLEYALALHVVKTAIPVNFPLYEKSINKALGIAKREGLDEKLLKSAIEYVKERREER